MIGGIGVDLVDVGRLAGILGRSARFADQVFTTGERRHRTGRGNPAKHLAACFAAKEAFLKAVGIGLWAGVPLKQVEVVHESTRRPRLRLGPLARKALRRRGCRADRVV